MLTIFNLTALNTVKSSLILVHYMITVLCSSLIVTLVYLACLV